MNRTDRLYAIREELRRAGSRGRTAEQLAERFEVSTRTVMRDISTLQSGGFPVWARTGRIGGYVVDPAATLPPVAFTPSEISGLAVALAAQRGHPFGAEAHAALVKILAVVPDTVRARAERLAQRVWVYHDGNAQALTDSAIARTVGDGLAEQRVLALEYRDASGSVTRRRVDPQLLAYANGHWYLVAHCHLRDALRWFQLGRILGATLTRQQSEDRPIADIGEPPVGAAPVLPG